MKKILIVLVTIWLTLITAFISFECFSWYHFGDIPTTSAALRFSVCFILLIGIFLWINLKINDRLVLIKDKKKSYLMYSFIIVFLIVYSILGLSILLKNNENFLKSLPFTVVTSELESTKEPYLYTTLNGQKIYSYLEHIQINSESELIELKEFLKENPNALEEMINNMKLIEIYRDGGTKLYKDSKDFTNEGLTIIKCNKRTAEITNTDIYIGPYETEYKSPICENTRIVKINDTLYYDTKEESKILGRCGTGMKEILYSVSEDEIPTRNYESNFGINYKVMDVMKENTIEILIDEKWMIFTSR